MTIFFVNQLFSQWAQVYQKYYNFYYVDEKNTRVYLVIVDLASSFAQSNVNIM